MSHLCPVPSPGRPSACCSSSISLGGGIAVDHLLDEKVVVPDLIHYFTPKIAASLVPLTHLVPSEAALEVYETLNPSQCEAVKCAASHGPFSLFQDPLGTSMTLCGTTAK
jgi:hypothetical protein